METIENVLNAGDMETVRREIKAIVNGEKHLRIIVVSGIKSPFIINQNCNRGWYTKAGERINSPAAYSKRGFSNMVYYSDRREIRVGIDWLRKFAGTKSFK